MSNFRADCSRCCGLCCIVPAQLAVQGFPIDKAADTACVHLDACNRCTIHASRPDHGYDACGGFDCFGAGQWITQTIFAGATWFDSPQMAARMSAAYEFWRPRFEAAALLEAALPHVHEHAKPLLVARIATLTDADSTQSATALDGRRLRGETLALIRSLLLDKPAQDQRLPRSAALD